MYNLLFVTLFVAFSIAFRPFEIKAGTPDKNILILFSLSPTTPAYRPLLEGIRQKIFTEYGSSFNMHIEYLETENYSKNSYPKERFELLNEKYKDVKLELLVCIGINIIPVIKEYGNSYFLHLPAISIDLDFSKYGNNPEMLLNNQTAELRLKIDYEKSISEALRLFPDTRNIFFIAGSSRSDSLFLWATKKDVLKFENRIKPVFIINQTMEDVMKEVPNLPEKSILILVSFSRDANGVRYYNPESVRLINKIASVPVFTLSDMGFGNGSVGGHLLSFEKSGLIAGEIAVKILNGADPNSFKVTENECYDHIYDYRELKRWNIPESDLPKGSKVLYKEPNFLLDNLWIIVFASLIMVLQSLFIVRLIKMHGNQKVLNKKIIEAENQYRQLYREDRILRLGNLTASLSHELNQPLTAILSMAQVGIRFIDSNNADPEMMKEIFLNIVDDDKRAASIIAVVRGMVKHEKREKEKVNLNNIIKQVLELFRRSSVEMKSSIYVEPANRPIYIIADAIQMQQVLMNLISNAQQSIEKTEYPNKTIIIDQSLENGTVTVSVRDFGKGIDDSIKNTLFKPFSTSRKEGLGFGLAICRSIIEDHQGTIWAENMPDGGAKFSFKLKIHEC